MFYHLLNVMNGSANFPNFMAMWGAPVDVKVYTSGDTKYYCMALAGNATALTDTKFKIVRKIDIGGAMDSVAHAFMIDPISGIYKGGQKYELSAADLATVAAYEYRIN